MTIVEKFYHFFRKIRQKNTRIININERVINLKPIIIFISVIFFSILLFIITNSLKKTSLEKEENLSSITSSKEFSNLTNYLITKIKSPYEEVNYQIQNNDSIEKILKKFNIRNEDIKIISNKLKQKNLSNIYSGRKLSLIFKKLDDGSKTVINLLFPINHI